ncbi:MAG: SCO family protein [Armatimonadetes bacterium]|nr:SCO family protein [Armatimonadota bacterium]
MRTNVPLRPSPFGLRISRLPYCAARIAHRFLMASVLAISAFATAQDTVKTPFDDKIGITQKLGSSLPLGLKFKDETGATVRLGDYFKDRPVVIVPVFYECKSACLMTRDGVVQVLGQQKKERIGRDFDVLVFSFKSDETTKMAADAKKYWMEHTRYGENAEGWHFLTGDEASIQSLTSAIGFRFHKVPEMDTIVHPTCIVFATPDGRVSYYQEGANYAALEFQTAVEEAKRNQVGTKSPTIRFPACYAYDPTTGKYRVAVENILLWSGLATVAIVAGSIIHMSLKYRRTPLKPGDAPDQGGTDANPSEGH